MAGSDPVKLDSSNANNANNFSVLDVLYGDGASERVANANVLVVGAGGVGCELLKNLAFNGFRKVTVIDLDTIDVSNLNRQFLFRREHVGKSKAEMAANAIRAMQPSLQITGIVANIKEPRFDVDYFKSFNIVCNALDNLDARRHVNRICLAAEVPLIESGSTGYLGQVTIHAPGFECYDCIEKKPQKAIAVCTIRSTPEKPIHCIVWAKSLWDLIFGPDDDGNVLADLDGEPNSNANVLPTVANNEGDEHAENVPMKEVSGIGDGIAAPVPNTGEKNLEDVPMNPKENNTSVDANSTAKKTTEDAPMKENQNSTSSDSNATAKKTTEVVPMKENQNNTSGDSNAEGKKITEDVPMKENQDNTSGDSNVEGKKTTEDAPMKENQNNTSGDSNVEGKKTTEDVPMKENANKVETNAKSDVSKEDVPSKKKPAKRVRYAYPEPAKEFADRVCARIFVDDIAEQAAMKTRWKSRAPPTVFDVSATAAASEKIDLKDVNLLDQRKWDRGECARILYATLLRMVETRKEKIGTISFDKDDDDALAFVVAAANLRAAAYGVPLSSPFEVKGIAGNIIHAIATTNAVVGGLVVQEALKVVTSSGSVEKCLPVYIAKFPGGSRVRRLINSSDLQKPKKNCYVCSKGQLQLTIDTDTTTLKMLVDNVLKTRLSVAVPSVYLTSGSMHNILYECGEGLEEDEIEDYEKNLTQKLKDLKVTSGAQLDIEDLKQNLKCVVHVNHLAGCEEDKPVAERFLLSGVTPVATESNGIISTGVQPNDNSEIVDVDANELSIVEPSDGVEAGDTKPSSSGEEKAVIVDLGDTKPPSSCEEKGVIVDVVQKEVSKDEEKGVIVNVVQKEVSKDEEKSVIVDVVQKEVSSCEEKGVIVDVAQKEVSKDAVMVNSRNVGNGTSNGASEELSNGSVLKRPSEQVVSDVVEPVAKKAKNNVTTQ